MVTSFSPEFLPIVYRWSSESEVTGKVQSGGTEYAVEGIRLEI